jgi:hypothetical protein
MAIVPTIPLPLGTFGPFPPRGEGMFSSAGDIDIWWTEPEAAAVFRLEDRRRSSTHIFGEDQNTTVWRSAPITVGSQDDSFGVPIGLADSSLVVANGDIRILPQTAIDPRAGQHSRRRIYAELHSLQMAGQQAEILAGDRFLQHLTEDLKLTPAEVAQVFRRSYGEVISWDLTGDIQRDFPADNHFNVFFAVKFGATSDSPAFTVYNREPLVVVDLGVTSLPPFDRVTIPQFPYDIPQLYYVKDPTDQLGIGEMVAGRGGCCAHSVRLQFDLVFRPVNFDELAGGLSDGAGFSLRSGTEVSRDVRPENSGRNQTSFRRVASRYVDSVFVPNGVTQIASAGLTFAFEDTTAGGISDAVRNGLSVVEQGGEARPIVVQAPMDALAYQPPQAFGIGLGPNGGITFDIAALREDNPDFYLVSLVALEGLSSESPRGSSARLRILVDGVEVPFANNWFNIPGTSRPVSIDLQTAQRYVTLTSTSTTLGGNGVFALFQLRGFGSLAGESLIEYSGPARPIF